MHIAKKVHFHNFSICEALNMLLKINAIETSPAFSNILHPPLDLLWGAEIFFLSLTVSGRRRKSEPTNGEAAQIIETEVSSTQYVGFSEILLFPRLSSRINIGRVPKFQTGMVGL